MSVVAKFECSSVTPLPYDNGVYVVHAYAVYGNGRGNEHFSDATPFGNFSMGIKEGRPAATYFKQGKRYLVTFTEVEE
jgi:hypothetical protein